MLMVACSKKQTENSIATFTISNNFSQQMFVNIYPSRESYNKNKDAYKYVVPANGRLTLYYPPFQKDISYVTDWYNGDYTITNWGKAENSFVPASESGGDYTIELTNDNAASYTSVARAVWLKGIQTFTKWKAVDVYGRGKNGNLIPISNFLSDDQKFFEIIVHKDFTGSYQKIKDGKPFGEQLMFQPSFTATTDNAMLKTARNEPVVFMNSNFTTTTASYYSQSPDTMMAYMAIDTLTFYKMVRQ
ncbi:MAG: hypothetical protein EOP51_03285 [Sphingobacteriales bacterium]|nr:MAG: hypothetical protein EOP51_03285 [Sphingobacteriales bacterium]